jgi:3-deoxy-D-manno-octulosonate 8-phosphate phosphatase (KDO 8-P phosphatase)
MGDDLPDLEAMKLASLPACPDDAAPEIKSIAHYISPLRGGEGCVRDVIEKVMKLNGNWNELQTVTSS